MLFTTMITITIMIVIIVIARHRASTSTRWHFAFALCCHSNETRAPIVNSPNNAQLGGTSYHSPRYIRVRAVLWACGLGETGRQAGTHTHRQTRVNNIHFASSTTHAKCSDDDDDNCRWLWRLWNWECGRQVCRKSATRRRGEKTRLCTSLRAGGTEEKK